MAGPLALNMMVAGHVSWADANRFGPGYWNGWAVGPESHSTRIGLPGITDSDRNREFLNLHEEHGERQDNDEDPPSAIPVAGRTVTTYSSRSARRILRFVPPGTADNSPPFQRWVNGQKEIRSPGRDERSSVPAGTSRALGDRNPPLKRRAIFECPWRDKRICRFHNLRDAVASIQQNWPDFDLEATHPVTSRDGM